jgi:serine/threonine protein kinase
MDVYQAGRIVFDVSEGVELAHGQAIFHRDLKPQNIMLKGQIPKVSDWGLSKVMAERKDSAAHVVSPLYAAPEQISARTFGQPDHRTDIYQLGIVFYELVTAKTPFTGDNVVDLMAQIVGDEPISTASIMPATSAVEPIIMKCLRKRMDERYQSIGELQADLTRFLELKT